MDFIGFFSSLDLPTLWFVLGISALLQASVWALLSMVLMKYPGGKTATLASLLIALGTFLFSLQGYWPAFLTVIPSNTFTLGGTIAYYIAFCRFTGWRVNRLFVGGALVVTLGAMLYFYYLAPVASARIIVVSLLIALVLFVCARILFQSARPEYRAGARILLVLVILLGLALLARAAITFLSPLESVLTSAAAQTMIIIASLVVTYLALGGAMVMFGQRLRYDLNLTNTRLERRVAERTAELEAANLELESLVRTMAHDLRAPIRAMIGFSHLLEEYALAQLDEDSRHYVSRVKTGAGRMGQMIDDLLAYLHLGRQPLRKQQVDATALARSAMAELLQARKLGGQMRVEIAELPPCRADLGMLRLVFSILLDNALKFSAPRPQPYIQVGAQDGVYFVRDNGVGFDPQYAEKLFGIFERLHGVDEFEGTGIGLALVKRIVERHGGRVWAEAELDRGATFFFTLDRD
jgi:signal transduction histidine kinase